MNATEVLAGTAVCSLPISPAEVADYYGVKVVRYSDYSEVYDISCSELYHHSRYGFSFYDDKHYICAINENACGGIRRRWTMAHELGHIFLGHIAKGSGIKQQSMEQERDADRFAAELLAPMVLLHFCGVSSSEELARLCMISKQAAEIRFEELCRCRKAAAECLHKSCPVGALALDKEETAELLSQFVPFTAKYLCERSRHDGYAQYLAKKRSDGKLVIAADS